MYTFDTPVPISAVLNIPAGRVQLVAADRTDTAVDVQPTDTDRRRDVKAAARTTVTYADGVLRVDTTQPANSPFGPTGSLDVTVHLPAGSRVQATTASARLRSVGRLGEVAFDGAYRDITIDEAASLHLTAVDGDVRVGHLDGPAHVSTARGDIHVTEATRGTVVLHTHSGAISVGAANGVSAALNANTAHGRVSNALRNDGTAELDIHATTSHGDIVARSL